MPAATPAQLEKFTNQGTETSQSPRAQEYMDAVRKTQIVQDMLTRQMDWEWAEARLVVDDPAKALDRAQRKDYLTSSLEHVMGPPKSELLLVSPYFVPTKAGMAGFTSMRARGVQVSILTNALEATDTAVVHAGYAKWRKDLLRQGAEAMGTETQRHWRSRRHLARKDAFRRQRRVRKQRQKLIGASLHAKTFAVDREQAFVGSFNFDPRSAALNTEMGLVIPALRSWPAGSWQRLTTRYPSPLTRYNSRPRASCSGLNARREAAKSAITRSPARRAGADSPLDLCRCSRSTGCCDAEQRKRVGPRPAARHSPFQWKTLPPKQSG